MAIDFQPANPSVTSLVGHRSPAPTTQANYRSSYGPDNAKEYKPLFDALIAGGGKPIEVTTEVTGYKPSTLHKNANDALKFLSDFDTTDDKRYMKLRQALRISKQTTGILCYFKPALAAILSMKAATTSDDDSTWRTLLESWLGTAQTGQIWDSKEVLGVDIVVTPSDHKWLMAMVAPLDGVELDEQPNRVRVMR